MSRELFNSAGKRLYLTDSERKKFLAAADQEERQVRTFCYVLAHTGCRISEALQLVGERIGKFPVSGELNYRVPDAKEAIAAVEARYAPQATIIDRIDGVSFEFPNWRFNLRSSNTEPLIRLNVEARGSVTLLQAKTEELLALLKSQGAVAADT